MTLFADDVSETVDQSATEAKIEKKLHVIRDDPTPATLTRSTYLQA